MLYHKLLALLLFLPACLPAQEHYVFQHLTVEDGLISNSKVNVYQDAQGFYWFFSVSGIQRFDGKSFMTYSYDYKTKNVGGGWTNFLEDKEKNIWTTNSEGINIFLRKQRIFTRLYMNDALDSNTNNVVALLKDENGVIWIVTHKNIYQFNYATHKPVLFCNVLHDEHLNIASAFYNTKIFWLLIFGANKQLAAFNCKTRQLTFSIKNIDELLGHPNPLALFKLDDNNLWIVNYLGDVCKYNLVTMQATHYSILHEIAKEKIGSPNSTLFDCLDDGNGSVWFGGDNYVGLLRYDKRTNTFSTTEYENGSEYGLHYDEDIYSFFKDHEGNIWVDTDLGMNIFNPQKQQFKYLSKKNSYSVTQFSTDVTSIFESRAKDIWISTWGNGVFKYDSNFILREIYVHDKNNAVSFGEPLNKAWCFSEDAKGKIWVGCQYAMLCILDTASNRFTNKIIPEFDKRTIMHLADDNNNNNIWFALFDGRIAKRDATSGKITVYKFRESSSPINGLSVDEKNCVWLTSEQGLYCFDENKNMLIKTVLRSQDISSPYLMNDSLLICGTSGAGFFIYNKFTQAAHFYSTTNGLSSNIVYGAVPGNSNTMWVFTNHGIEQLNISTGKIFKYDVNDGIKDHIFLNAFCKLKNGNILVAAKSGVIYFNPNNIQTKSPPPDVVITNFSAAQRNLSDDSLLSKRYIGLAYNQNLITIEYASLSFVGRKTDQYFYKLKGVDKDWIAAGTNRSVTYANLSPGNYIFQVKSRNADGIETKNITTLSITIYSPWWRTWWAYLLWFVMAAFIIYIVYDYRRRSRAALSLVRQKIASDLHDDIGSALNSISVYSEVAGKQLQNNVENAKTLLEKMGSASRNMIDTMNDIVWSVNPKNDQFENILQRMQYFAGELLSGKNILLQFDSDEKVKNIKLPMEKRKNVYLIFKEAVHNAYKYSNSKTVKVSLALYGNMLSMKISDEGTGFDKVKEGLGGNGLKNMQLRAKEIHAELNIESRQMEGTSVELRMPLK